MVPDQVVTSVLERKTRQRLREYGVLVLMLGFFVSVFTPVVELGLALPIGLLALAMGMSLAWLREYRRLLANSYYRLAVEASESFLLLVLLGGSAFLAHGLRLSLVLYQAHLSYALFGYLVGSLAGEVGWRRLVFGRLLAEQQYRYVQNLSPSVLLPYSWRHFRLLWRRWRDGREG